MTQIFATLAIVVKAVKTSHSETKMVSVKKAIAIPMERCMLLQLTDLVSANQILLGHTVKNVVQA